MILFCGIPSETPLRLAIEEAQRLGIDHVVFNQRTAAEAEICVDMNQRGLSGVLVIGNLSIALESISGVYTRMIGVESIPEYQVGNQQRWESALIQRVSLIHDILRQWIEIAPCRVLNRVGPMLSNASKPYQAQLIKAVGFMTPVTLITNDPVQVKAFKQMHGDVIFKSTSGVRSIVKRLTAEREEGLDKVRHLPTQFQAFVPGRNVRVHVVGDQAFATLIHGDALDYRYSEGDDKEMEMSAFELPDEVRRQCIALSESLELPLCGIDLKVTPEGAYYCFEVNPSPAYSYYQQYSDQPIATAITKYLSAAAG